VQAQLAEQRGLTRGRLRLDRLARGGGLLLG
jgi:hypothetical protein